MKVEAHQLIYPLLCLSFSGADVHTLTELRRIVQKDDAWQALRRTYAARPTAEPAELQAFDDVRTDLRMLFDFLRTSGWEGMWKATALPRVRAYIAGHAEIRSYDGVGARPPARCASLTAYVMAYGSSHGVLTSGTTSESAVSCACDDAAWPRSGSKWVLVGGLGAGSAAIGPGELLQLDERQRGLAALAQPIARRGAGSGRLDFAVDQGHEAAQPLDGTLARLGDDAGGQYAISPFVVQELNEPRIQLGPLFEQRPMEQSKLACI